MSDFLSEVENCIPSLQRYAELGQALVDLAGEALVVVAPRPGTISHGRVRPRRF